MNYLFYEVDAGPQQVIQVTLDKQANVKVMDAANYHQYRSGRRYTYYGGLATVTPFRISPPSHGHWYVVIDLGGYPGTVRASVSVLG